MYGLDGNSKINIRVWCCILESVGAQARVKKCSFYT